ncbi:MAG: ankyrin repeat domain-containing protein [Fimbriimonas sp.]|nr:ankyrin repeat domain-containing protein [Fimbriimonas sp.]
MIIRPALAGLLAIPIAANLLSPAVSLQSPHRFVVQDERPIDQKLFAAVRGGNVERVRQLLAAGADPNANEANGWRPLIELYEAGINQLEIAKLLIDKGAYVNYCQPDQGWTPLTAEMERRDISIPLITFLLSKGADPKAVDSEGNTTMHLAVRAGSIEAIKLLLAKGVGLSARTHTPMIRRVRNMAVADGANGGDQLGDREAKLQEEELSHGFEPGYVYAGKTPAFEVVVNFHREVAEFLRKSGADFRATDDNGWTILHEAVKQGDLAAVRWLLGIGLDPNAPSNGGFRPLHVAMRVGFFVPDERMVQVLVAAGAKPSLKNRSGQTPLELLRSDIAWRLRATNPRISQQSGFVARYLKTGNEVAKMLDPNAAPIEKPAAVAGPHGFRYAPLDFIDAVAQREVRVEGSRAILRLSFEPTRRDVGLKIKSVMLEDYEPLSPAPYRMELSKGKPQTFEIEFPAAAGSGGAVDMSFDVAYRNDSRQSGGGEFAEGAQIAPMFTYGQAIACVNQVPGRTMQVRLDKVIVGGKELKALAGRILKIGSGKTVSTGLPAPTSRKRVNLRYSVRLIPNRQWSHSETTF